MLVALSVVWLASPHRGGSPAPAKDAVLAPVDEAAQEPSFLRFRDDLLEAVRRRDVAGVMGKAHERLVARGLARELTLGPSPRSPSQPEHGVWKALEQVLTLGGSFVTERQRLHGRGAELGDPEFCAPYVYSAFPVPPPNGLGEAVAGVLLRESVSLHVAPSAGSRVGTTRSYEIVRYDTWRPLGRAAPGWTAVTTLDGVFGYVPSESVRSVTDYHACFGRLGGQWLMTDLVTGDYP